MNFREAQAQARLTDRELRERTLDPSTGKRVSTRTISRIKNPSAGPPRLQYRTMERLAGALGVEVEEIDEFREAIRQRAIRDAKQRGVPDEVLDEIMEDQGYLRFGGDFSERTIQYGALRLFKDTAAYLERAGRGDDAERIWREVHGDPRPKGEEQ